MDVEQFREECLKLPFVTEDMPFDDTLVAFRLKGKIFACLPTDRISLVVLKCDEAKALELREQYSSIESAWHWNKKYWNQIHLDSSLTDDLIISLIHHAYSEVNKKLPKREQVSDSL